MLSVAAVAFFGGLPRLFTVANGLVDVVGVLVATGIVAKLFV